MAKNSGKFPWIRSVFGRKNVSAPKCVYAGPEYFRNKNKAAKPDEPAAPEESAASANGNTVYPENAAESGSAKEDGFDFDDGEKLPPLPKMPEDPRMFMCVYAGPEFFAPKPDGENGGGAYLTEEQLNALNAQPAPGGRTRKCAKCGAEYPEEVFVCPECRARVEYEDGKVACTGCGAHLPPRAKFCSECGAPQQHTDV